ncbi:MAG: hypothetical protein JWL64_2584 [Frankiales bacterium]|nr:hypothetical protein [Frankiales bacterium]
MEETRTGEDDGGGRRTLTTVGHGQLPGGTFAGLLAGAGITNLVDIRRYPASRRHPDLAGELLAATLAHDGIDYRWEPDLGGRRHLPAAAPVLDPWWTVPAFRAYAAHTRTAEFQVAVQGVLQSTREQATSVMCSESVWWRCHRRLVADVVTLVHGVTVRHLMPDGSLRPHRPAEGARLSGGTLYWDAVAPGPPVPGPR